MATAKRKSDTGIVEPKESEEHMSKELTATASVVNDMLLGEIDDTETEKRVLDACLTATDSKYGMIGKMISLPASQE